MTPNTGKAFLRAGKRDPVTRCSDIFKLDGKNKNVPDIKKLNPLPGLDVNTLKTKAESRPTSRFQSKQLHVPMSR